MTDPDVAVSFVNDDEVHLKADGDRLMLSCNPIHSSADTASLYRRDDVPLLIQWLQQFVQV